MPSGPVELIQHALPVVLIAGVLTLLVVNWKRLSQPTHTGDAPETCPGCGYDVRGGLLRCPECGRPTPAERRRRLADLRTRWPTETLVPRVPDPDEQPVVVLTTDQAPAADLLRQHLEARGIAARTAGPQPIGYAAYQHVMGGHKLVVWSADAERARAIVASLWVVDEDEPVP